MDARGEAYSGQACPNSNSNLRALNTDGDAFTERCRTAAAKVALYLARVTRTLDPAPCKIKDATTLWKETLLAWFRVLFSGRHHL